MNEDDVAKDREEMADEGDDFRNGCAVCRQLEREGHDAMDYSVVPARGGGWQAWSAALLRLVAKMGSQPTQAVIITQSVVNYRYVQFLIGHGIAHAEVASNVYLMGDSRLSAADEAALAAMGWRPPASDEDDPDKMPANWSLPLNRGNWGYLVEMLLAAMVGALGFQEGLPVEIRTFMCDHPCRACSWPADDALSEMVSA